MVASPLLLYEWCSLFPFPKTLYSLINVIASVIATRGEILTKTVLLSFGLFGRYTA